MVHELGPSRKGAPSRAFCGLWSVCLLTIGFPFTRAGRDNDSKSVSQFKTEFQLNNCLFVPLYWYSGAVEVYKNLHLRSKISAHILRVEHLS